MENFLAILLFTLLVIWTTNVKKLSTYPNKLWIARLIVRADELYIVTLSYLLFKLLIIQTTKSGSKVEFLYDFLSNSCYKLYSFLQIIVKVSI